MSEVEIRRSMELENPLFPDNENKPLVVKIKRRDPKVRKTGKKDHSDYSELLQDIKRQGPVDEKTLLTKAVADDLRTYMLRGLNEDQACELAGISPSTYSQWLLKYPKFKEFINRVKAQVEYETLEHIHTAMDGGVWAAAAWFLERKYPQRYGKRDVLKQQIYHIHHQFIKVVLNVINQADPTLKAKIINDLRTQKIDLEG